MFFSLKQAVRFLITPGVFLKKIIRRQFFLIFVSVLVGIIVGLASVFLKESIEYLLQTSYKGKGEIILSSLYTLPFYYFLTIPALGGLIVGILKRFFFQGEAKGGVEQVMESLAVKEGHITFKEVVGKFISSSITIGTGGSAGKEGPVVHIGGGIGSVIGRYFSLPAEYVKALVGAGAAAGIGAAFNAPIAGCFFALEILIGDFSLNIFSMIMASSISATAISRHFLGEHPAFLPPHFDMTSPIEIFYFILLGLVAGLVCALFIKTLIKTKAFFDHLRIPQILKPALGGLLLGCLALGVPSILGVGYGTIDGLLKFKQFESTYTFFSISHTQFPEYSGWFLLLGIGVLLVSKVLATSLTLGSGGTGGTIVPALFLGATLGAFMGQLANLLTPWVHISIGAFALIGMSSIIAGTTQAPIMAILLFFETTRSYNIILPVATVAIITSQMTKFLMHGSMYTLELRHMGIDLYEGMEKTVMSTIRVIDIMRKDLLTIPFNMQLRKIMEIFLKTRFTTAIVLNDAKEIVGKINLDDLRQLVETPSLYNVLIASEIMEEDVVCLTKNDPLSKSVEKMSASQLNLIPVVEKSGSKKPIGYITRKDILTIYEKEILKKNISGIKFKSIVSDIHKFEQEEQQSIDFTQDYAIKTLNVPKDFWGKTLADSMLRQRYGVTVLAVRDSNRKEHIIPGPDYILKSDDKIVIAINKKDLDKLPS